jgi:hypothetical protein
LLAASVVDAGPLVLLVGSVEVESVVVGIIDMEVMAGSTTVVAGLLDGVVAGPEVVVPVIRGQRVRSGRRAGPGQGSARSGRRTRPT